jgi:hypothetical protein
MGTRITVSQLHAAAPECSFPLGDQPVSQPALSQTVVGHSVMAEEVRGGVKRFTALHVGSNPSVSQSNGLKQATHGTFFQLTRLQISTRPHTGKDWQTICSSKIFLQVRDKAFQSPSKFLSPPRNHFFAYILA